MEYIASVTSPPQIAEKITSLGFKAKPKTRDGREEESLELLDVQTSKIQVKGERELARSSTGACRRESYEMAPAFH